MQRFKIWIILVFSIGILSCEENTYLFEVEEIEVLPNNAGKEKSKSLEQYLTLLYSNIYQRALSPSGLVDVSEVMKSIGDKQVAFEVVAAKILSDPQAIALLPTQEEMRSDPEAFIVDTYKRFYVRIPSEAEKAFFVNFIESHPQIQPLHVYFAFATSNEYYFY